MAKGTEISQAENNRRQIMYSLGRIEGLFEPKIFIEHIPRELWPIFLVHGTKQNGITRIREIFISLVDILDRIPQNDHEEFKNETRANLKLIYRLEGKNVDRDILKILKKMACMAFGEVHKILGELGTNLEKVSS